MLQSSSPSYVLMASIDSCIDLLENHRKELFDPYAKRLKHLRKELSGLKKLQLIETKSYDRSKVMISVRNTDISSRQLYSKLLEDYHLQMEMAAGTYILAMTSVGDTQEGMDRLIAALKEIDAGCGFPKERETDRKLPCLSLPDVVYNSSDIENLMKRMVLFRDSVGQIAAEYVYLYPPGIPLVIPGEKVTKEAADMLQWYYGMGFPIEGLKDGQYIEVLAHG